jgi:REP element-mobilizing transposase RayT
MAELHARKPNRLKGYDYSQNGAYFITICTKNKEKVLGEIVGGGLAHLVHIKLSEQGKIVDNELKNLSSHYFNVCVDRYVIMPNHIHLIAIIGENQNDLTGQASLSRTTVGNIIGGLKSGISRLCGIPIWQRSYHDHIIRSEQEYVKIAEYIENNPVQWNENCFYRSGNNG